MLPTRNSVATISPRAMSLLFFAVLAVFAQAEQRLGASRRSSGGLDTEAAFRPVVVTLPQQHRGLTALDTCAAHMMSSESFLECVRDDEFYTEDTCGGALLQRTNDWCNLDGNDVCCGDSISCCEVSAAGKAVGFILFIFILFTVIICSCACCRYVKVFFGFKASVRCNFVIFSSPHNDTYPCFYDYNLLQLLSSVQSLLLRQAWPQNRCAR